MEIAREMLDDFSEKQKRQIMKKLSAQNAERVRNVSLILIILSVLLFLTDYLNEIFGKWVHKRAYIALFQSHIILLVGVLFYILVYKIIRNKDKEIFYNIYSYSFIVFIVNLCAYISGRIDQEIHGEITLYVLSCFFIAMYLYMSPKFIIFLYSQTYVVLLTLTIITQNDPEIRQGHFLNSTLVAILSGFMATTISKLMQRDMLYKLKLREMVEVRSNDLIQKQKEVNRLQQLNLIGQMAGGMAHEIRNPMTTVRGFLQLLGNKEHHKKQYNYFELMISELDRANGIIEQFLSLAKDKVVVLQKKSLNEIILKLSPLIEANLSFKQNLRIDLQDIPKVFLDEKELCQVILNITKNGCEAMPNGGNLTISTYQQANNVMLEIQDEGTGIDPENLDKIGTPFFTTKENGTGLGLAVCYNIVKKHNAIVKLLSNAKGTKFTIVFSI